MLLSGGVSPKGATVVVEPKWDGIRAIVTVRDAVVSIRSRNGHDVTDCYPELLRPPTSLAGRSAFDGEIVAFDERGRVDFQRLQQRMNRRRPSMAQIGAVPVIFVVFDVLWLDGEDLTSRPLRDRCDVLDGIGIDGLLWQVTRRLQPPVDADTLEAYRAVGVEGLVYKGDGPYRPGTRSRDWVKVKFRRTRLAVIGGHLNERSRYGSLAVGAFHDGELRYIGQVGNSLARRFAEPLEMFLGALAHDAPSFVDLEASNITHLEPFVVVEVSYTEVTAAGTMRQPVLVAVRPDVAAETVELGEEFDAARARRRVRIGAGQRL